MNRKVGIVGAGRFGTAFAFAIEKAGSEPFFLARKKDVADSINATGINPKVEGVKFGANVRATIDPAIFAEDCRLVVLAVPTQLVDAEIKRLAPVLTGRHFVVHAIGGVTASGERISEVIENHTEVLRVGALAGPALFGNLVDGRLASLVVASRFPEIPDYVESLIEIPGVLEVKKSNDLIGVEVAAAASGVYAVLAGLSDSIIVDPVANASLLVHALQELRALIATLGGNPNTANGLAGLGNLVVRMREENPDYLFGKSGGTRRQTEGARSAIRLAKVSSSKTPLLSLTDKVIRGQWTVEHGLEVARKAVLS